mgnify:CR=1 FL=1
MKKIKMKGGLDVPLHGSVKNINIDVIEPRFSAVLAEDYFGLKPKILVKEGDFVSKGDPLWEDKTNNGLQVKAPISGHIHEINRGEKRALVSVVINKSGDQSISFNATGSIEQDILKAGLWDSFRERPFNRVPIVGTSPDFLFINACKVDGLEANPSSIIEIEKDAFKQGLSFIEKMTNNHLYLCTNESLGIESEKIKEYLILENYPSGNSSIHIQHLKPLTKNTNTWTINWQDVIRIGKALHHQKYCFESYVSVCGPACNEPKIIKTNLGANMDELTAGNYSGDVRQVSGSLLYGRSGDSYSNYVTRYANQVSIVSDEKKATFFNWLKPGSTDHSNSNVFISSFLKPEKFNFDTNINGGYRAIVPIGVFDEVNPFEIDPTLFLKSLAIGDLVALRELGIFDLIEEDMAIFSYVCPSKYDYVALFNDCMELIWKEETS